MEHVDHFRWTAQPLEAIQAAAARAAHKMHVAVVSVEFDDDDLSDIENIEPESMDVVIVVAAGGDEFALRLGPGELGADLRLDTRGMNDDLARESLDFFIAFSSELGDAMDDAEVTEAYESREPPPAPECIGPPNRIVYKALDRDGVVVARGDVAQDELQDGNPHAPVLHRDGRKRLRIRRAVFQVTGVRGEHIRTLEWTCDADGAVIATR